MSSENKDKDTNEEELMQINAIYSSGGNNKDDWIFLSLDITNEKYAAKIVPFLKNKMIQDPKNLLNLDIIDYIINNGCPAFINLIAQKDFLDTFLNLLKSETKAGLENQKKVIYLTQKWAKKFSNNPNYRIFIENYKLLKNKGICFPPLNFEMDTYNKYVKKYSNNINNNQQKQQSNPSNQNNTNQQNASNNNNNSNNNQNNINSNNNQGNNRNGNPPNNEVIDINSIDGNNNNANIIIAIIKITIILI
jgi:hypothetical protein